MLLERGKSSRTDDQAFVRRTVSCLAVERMRIANFSIRPFVRMAVAGIVSAVSLLT